MAGEIVGVIHVFVAVESLSKNLQGRVALSYDAQTKLVFFFQKDRDTHDDQPCARPPCFEPSPR